MKIKLFIVIYIGVGILVRLVMVEEIINNFLNFDIEVNIWIYLKVKINWIYNGVIKFYIYRGNYFF